MYKVKWQLARSRLHNVSRIQARCADSSAETGVFKSVFGPQSLYHE